jgi:hypothetical protein
MRKHTELVVSQVSIPQINFDIGTATARVVPPPSSVGSALDHQKYPVDEINEPTPCTLLYVKLRMLRTFEVANAIVMATRIMHGRPAPSKCDVAKVTTTKEGHEFEDLDYPHQEEGIEKLKDDKGNFILWPHKNIIIKIRSTLIVLPQSREDEGTPTSQNTIHSTAVFTPPSQNPPKLPLLLKIHQLHNLLSIILLNIILLHMVILQSLLTLPLLKIQLNKLLIIILLHMVIPHSLLLTPPLVKIHQLNKLLSIVLLHMFILRSLLTLSLLFQIHQLNKLFSIVLLRVFILQSLPRTLPLLFKIHQMLRRSRMPLWMNPAKNLRPY